MNKRQFIYLIPIALLLLASCKKWENPVSIKEVRQLSFTVTDGGYTSKAWSNPKGATTRAVENGYLTEFTAGDACGLYLVRNNKTIYSNVKLIAQVDVATNSLVWIPDGSTALAGGLSGEQYYLYYPYQADMSGKTALLTGTAMTDEDFFASLISGWIPQTNQSSYTAYTASDLMTAKGTSTAAADNILQLSFSMAHRMSLAVIEMPKTVYQFSSSKIEDYTVPKLATYSGSTRPCRMPDGSYRYIIHPEATSAPTLTGSYDNGEREFTVQPSGITAGSYKRYKVDGVSEIQQSYTIEIGDYLLVDGNLLPKGTLLTEAQKASVAAIIFWTPKETDPVSEVRITPASLTDDKIMAKDFPACSHGLAVAVKKIPSKVWQNTYEFVKDFQEGANFTPLDKADYVSVASSDASTDNMNRILGYQNTKVIKAYNKWCKATSDKADYVVQLVDALEGFTADNPAPVTSTGWFVPSTKELHILCYKDVDNINQSWGYDKVVTRDKVEPSIAAVGGDQLGSSWYWSSTETQDVYLVAYNITFSSANIGFYFKFSLGEARAICAF